MAKDSATKPTNVSHFEISEAKFFKNQTEGEISLKPRLSSNNSSKSQRPSSNSERSKSHKQSYAKIIRKPSRLKPRIQT